MKFSKGDRFSVTENGLRGTIVDIQHNPHTNEYDYKVAWDNEPHKTWYYQASECDPIWDKVFTVKVNKPIEHITMNLTVDSITAEPCSHDWKVYDSGFSRFEYCSKCNVNKRG